MQVKQMQLALVLQKLGSCNVNKVPEVLFLWDCDELEENQLDKSQYIAQQLLQLWYDKDYFKLRKQYFKLFLR